MWNRNQQGCDDYSTFLIVPYTARASFRNRSQGLGLLESRENHLVGRFLMITVSARSPGIHSDQFFLPGYSVRTYLTYLTYLTCYHEEYQSDPQNLLHVAKITAEIQCANYQGFVAKQIFEGDWSGTNWISGFLALHQHHNLRYGWLFC